MVGCGEVWASGRWHLSRDPKNTRTNHQEVGTGRSKQSTEVQRPDRAWRVSGATGRSVGLEQVWEGAGGNRWGWVAGRLHGPESGDWALFSRGTGNVELLKPSPC